MSSNIHQEVSFAASPERVYSALTDSRQFSAMTGGAAASITPWDGGAFTCFGGFIIGRNLELIRNRRIVQAWRVKSWPEGIYSIVKFELIPDGDGTRVVLDHAGFPEGEMSDLEPGWHAQYWEPLKKYLA